MLSSIVFVSSNLVRLTLSETLGIDEIEISTLGGKKRGMASLFDHPTLIHDHYFVGFLNRGKPVGNHNRRPHL